MHGGGPDVVAGKPLDFVYKEEALDLVKVNFSYCNYKYSSILVCYVCMVVVSILF